MSLITAVKYMESKTKEQKENVEKTCCYLTNVSIYRIQWIFNANVFSELAVHTESKMIIFTSGLLQGFRLLFSGKFHIQSEGGGDD